MQWFKHPTCSHDDPDIQDAEDIFKDAGYNIFFKTLEIYGQEYSKLDDGKLTVSCTFLRRKLRKSWTVVEKVFNFYQERERIFYSESYGMVTITIPKFNELASNWTSRNNNKPTEVPTDAPTAKEVEVEVEKKKNIKQTAYSDEFLSFWKMYPKKTGKGAAWISWKKNKPNLSSVSESLSWQIKQEQWLKDGGQFIPNPATYINQRRWEDERQSKTVKPIESNQRPAWKYDTPDEDCITGDDLKGIIGNIGRGME